MNAKSAYEWGRQVGHLHVHRKDDTEPDRIVAEAGHDRNENWYSQQQDADLVHEHAKDEQHSHHQEQEHYSFYRRTRGVIIFIAKARQIRCENIKSWQRADDMIPMFSATQNP